MSGKTSSQVVADRYRAMSLEDLKGYENNARTHDAEQIKMLEASLLEYGWTRPIGVTDGVIRAGHGIFEAAQNLLKDGKCPAFWPDASQAPVVDLSHLSEAQRRAYVLADNELALRSAWDKDVLTSEVRALRDLGANLNSMGFLPGELEDMLKPVTAEDLNGPGPDEMPDEPPFAVAEQGEVWIMGQHRLVVGDPAEPSVMAMVLGSVRPHLMVTEVPDGGDAPKDESVWTDWREAITIFGGDLAYLWHDGLFTGRVAGSLQNSGFLLRAQIIWDMDRSVARGSDYPWQHTPCWYAAREKKRRHFGGRGQSTIWRIPEPEKSEGDKRVRLPVECLKRCIENSSSAGQAVYDPFLGAGTTIIAAELSGRSCLGVASKPLDADVVITRWQQFSGLAATLEGDGRTYAELRTLRAIRSSPGA